MTRIALAAMAATVALAASCASAWAQDDPIMIALFADSALPAVDDTELAGLYGLGLGHVSDRPNGGSLDRQAIILWDETRPPVASHSRPGGGDQATGNVTISVGVGTTP